MIKKITVASVVAMAIIGCGGSGSDSSKDTNAGSNFVTKNSKAVTIEGLKTMNSSIGIDNVSAKKLRNTTSSYETKSSNSDTDTVGNGMCSAGGSFLFSDDEKTHTMKLDAKNCKEESSFIDGELTMSDIGEESSSIEVLRTLSITDSSENLELSAAKGSKISITENKIEADFSLKINAETISVDNLVITGSDDEKTESSTIHFNSGAINVGEYYFEVVKQKSDFITDEGGIKSGLLELKDGAGHRVELSAKNNKISLKVDQNGDGSFDNSEILSEDITSEDFSF